MSDNSESPFSSSDRGKSDIGLSLTQDCVIQWADDDDRFPLEQQKILLLFQSPTENAEFPFQHSTKSCAERLRKPIQGRKNVDSPLNQDANIRRQNVIDHKMEDKRLLNDLGNHEESSVGSMISPQPLHTQPMTDQKTLDETSDAFVVHKRRRFLHQSVVNPTHPNQDRSFIETPVIHQTDHKRMQQLLFDLPSSWKDHFRARYTDTPAEPCSMPLQSSERNSVSSPLRSTEGDQSHISCRLDLGSAFFTHTSSQEDEANATRLPDSYKDPEVKDTYILDSSFDFIDFGEEDIAAVDAAVSAREASQQEAFYCSRSVSYSSNKQLCILPHIPSSYPSADVTAMAQPSFRNPSSNDDVPMTDDIYGEFPDIDFDTVDQLVARRGQVTSTVHDIIRPSDCSNRLEFIRFTRYVVCSVFDDTTSYQKILGVQVWSEKNEHHKLLGQRHKFFAHVEDDHGASNGAEDSLLHPDGLVYLKGEWYHAQCETRDIIHICSLSGRYDTGPSSFPLILNTQSVNADDLLLVVHPDLLVTPTAISETIHCNRRAVLMSRLGSSSLSSKAAAMGTLRHDLFERCLFHKNFSVDFAVSQSTSVIRNHAETLIGIGMVNESEIHANLMKTLPIFQKFATEYTSFYPDHNNSDGVLLSGHGMKSSTYILVDDVHATEECTVSHELGLKGFVDATVEVRGIRSSTHGFVVGPLPSKSLVAVELKTGHNQNAQHAHMAQLSLYTVLLRARYGSSTPDHKISSSLYTGQNGAAHSGVLLYLNDQSHQAIHVCPDDGEIKSLINQRNVVASELRRSLKPRGVELFIDENEMSCTNAVLRSSGKKGSRLTLSSPPPPSQLPDLLYSIRSCERCYSNRECMLYAMSDITSTVDKLLDDPRKTHKDLLDKFTGNLSYEELKYFSEWDRLIDLEAYSSNQDISTAWLVDSTTAERTSGKCISSLMFDAASVVKSVSSNNADFDDDIVLAAFYRSPNATVRTPINSLKISLGDIVVLSTDSTSLNRHDTNYSKEHQSNVHASTRKMHILRGTVKRLEEQSIHLRLNERDLRQVINIAKNIISCSNRPDEGETLFRLDKDESIVAITTLRKNLVDFLTLDVANKIDVDIAGTSAMANTEKSMFYRNRLPVLRKFIVRLDRPLSDNNGPKSLFETTRPQGFYPVQGCDLNSLIRDFSKLNDDQKAAVQKVFTSQDYTLIQGMPGSGKTSTISFVARLLAAHGKRVLITSYTHAAVDTLLLKLMECHVGTNANDKGLYDIVRLGQESQVHEKVRSINVSRVAIEYERSQIEATSSSIHPTVTIPKASLESLQRVIDAARIVGVSTLTIPRTPLLSSVHFDIVIIDEAGQISQPAILGAIMAAERFVLVGDHEQLPPLVQSQLAEQGGFNISMLKRLANAHPDEVAQLTVQYRMNDAICSLCNEVAYKGKLRCANDNVMRGQLNLKGFPAALANMKVTWNSSSGIGWLVQVIDPNKGVIFVNTDPLVTMSDSPQASWLEQSRGNGLDGGNLTNPTETLLARTIVHGLIICGLDVSMIGLISPYRSQIKNLEEDLYLSAKKKLGLEISTIDRYQGRDKEAIILSLVRSNYQGKTGRLLEDYRRLNVAFSRAKHKLIILGSYQTLTRGSSVLGPLLLFIKEKGWVENLPDNALGAYEEPTATQI